MFKKILLPIDLQDTRLSAKAAKITIDEARKHGAEVHVLTVIPDFGMPLVASFFPDSTMDKALKEVAQELKRYIAANFPQDVATKPHIGEGSPADQIVQLSRKLGTDLIIIPSHTKSFQQVFLGSCAARVVDRVHCSVMVVKD
jgi:universal stress protein F